MTVFNHSLINYKKLILSGRYEGGNTKEVRTRSQRIIYGSSVRGILVHCVSYFGRTVRQVFESDLYNMQTFMLLSSTAISFGVCLFVLFFIGHRDGGAFAHLTGKRLTLKRKP